MLTVGDFSAPTPFPLVVLNIPPPPSAPLERNGGALLMLLPDSFGADDLPKYPFLTSPTAAAVVPFNTPPLPEPASPPIPVGAVDVFPPTPTAAEMSFPFVIAPSLPVSLLLDRSVRYPPPTGPAFAAAAAAAKPLSDDFAYVLAGRSLPPLSTMPRLVAPFIIPPDVP